jgi:hypothetical protein
MALFALRMRDGNCLIIAADTEAEALRRAHEFRKNGAIASCREIQEFAAEFALCDDGDLKCVLQDPITLADLHTNEYPMLAAALTQSYDDFDSSVTDNRSKPVLFDDEARTHLEGWAERDREIVNFSVQQERERFSN